MWCLPALRWTVHALRPLARQEASRLWPSDAAVTHQLAGRIMSHGAEHRLAPALLDAAALFTSLASGREGQAWAGLRDGPGPDSAGMPAAYHTLTAMQPSWVGALPGVFNDAIEACDWSDRDALFHGLRRLACAVHVHVHHRAPTARTRHTQHILYPLHAHRDGVLRRPRRLARAHDYRMAGLSPMHMLYYPFAAGEAAGAVLRAHRHSARQLLAAAAAAAPVVGPPMLGASGARRLRVAYVMADWREHITLRLLAAVLGIHDATRMQV